MTFQHIVNQNLKYNFKRFISYLFVNSFVVAVLFMYGSLLFNEILGNDVAMTVASDFINMAAYAIILFSIAFVSYTGVYFVKSRGKEFSVYLTLGMTTRDLIRMIIFESLVIVAGSVICGILGGLLLSKLFYLILAKVLGLSTSIYYISYKTFLLSIGVFVLVFLFNMLFTSVFVRKLTILQIAKATSTKGFSKSRPVVGIIALIVLVAGMYFFTAASSGYDILSSVSDYTSEIVMSSVIAIFVSLYFVVASSIDAVQAVIAKFPALYNRNILILSSLKHRFFSYKVFLYMLSLLMSSAILFMGFGLSVYNFTKKSIDEFIPYEFMIESGGGINEISADEVQKVVADNGGTVSDFHALEYVFNENYRDYGNRLVNYRTTSFIVSESNFNRHTGMIVDVAPDELLLVYNQEAEAQESINYDTILTVEPWREGIKRADAFREGLVGEEALLQSLGGIPRFEFKREKTRSTSAYFINSYGNFEFAGVMANVVDDSVYASLKQAKPYTAYLFNLKSGDADKVFAGILDTLRAKNKADNRIWASPESHFGGKDEVESLRPIYKQERFDIAFRISGFLFFSLAFLGFLFLLCSSVVLYYKLATDVDDEKEHITLLRKIGLTSTECKSYLQKHVAIVFFAPLVIGGIIGLFFLNSALSFTVYVGYLMVRVGMMYGVFVLLDILLFLSLRKKFLRGAGLGVG